MRYLGIDYGRKRVGIALSDVSASFAFPHIVLKNDQNMLDELKSICAKYEVRKAVLGDSKDFEGKDNPIMNDINEFKKTLELDLNLEVVFEPEILSSQEAKQIQGNVDTLDASAAAIILKSYLDKQKHD